MIGFRFEDFFMTDESQYGILDILTFGPLEI
jgi:hypothetical protein